MATIPAITSIPITTTAATTTAGHDHAEGREQ